MWSPWGKIQHVTAYARGLSFVSTPSHGGFRVSKHLAGKRMLPEMIKRCAIDTGGTYYWFEEDCASCAVMLSFPEYFTAEQLEHCAQSLRHWYPGILPAQAS